MFMPLGSLGVGHWQPATVDSGGARLPLDHRFFRIQIPTQLQDMCDWRLMELGCKKQGSCLGPRLHNGWTLWVGCRIKGFDGCVRGLGLRDWGCGLIKVAAFGSAAFAGPVSECSTARAATLAAATQHLGS